MPETLLQLKDAHVHFGGVKALSGVSLKIDEGEIVALFGPNGAGKSIALKALFGLAPLARGQVLWRGEVIKPEPRQMVERGVAFVPQGRRVFSHLTVLENLEVGGLVLRDRRLARERVEEVLSIFPALRPRLKLKSGALSGGQQQMLAVGRGLMTDPKVLLLDEPSLGLAPAIVKEVFQLIRQINQDRRMAIVVVEHNIKSLLQLTDRAYVLAHGQVVLQGSPEDLSHDDKLEKILLGALV